MNISKQEFFDKGIAHVMRQGVPSIAPRKTDAGYPRCLYRSTHNGKVVACLVGAFIPDERYRPLLENTCLTDALRAAGIEDVTQSVLEFVRECQRVHDGAASAAAIGYDFLREFICRAGHVARSHKLDTFVLRGCIAARAGAL